MFSFFRKKSEAAPLEPFPDGPIVPRIKTTAFLNAASRIRGMAPESMPVAMPVVGDLLLTFGVDIGPAFVTLTTGEAARRKLGNSDLYSLAFQNIGPILERLEVKANGSVYQVVTGHDMEACAILFGNFWAKLATQMSDTPLVAFPHRNLVFCVPLGSAEGRASLRDAVARVNYDDPHALSRNLHVWGPGWKVYPA